MENRRPRDISRTIRHHHRILPPQAIRSRTANLSAKQTPSILRLRPPRRPAPHPRRANGVIRSHPRTLLRTPRPRDFPTLNAFNNAWVQWENEGHQYRGFTTRTPQRYQYKARQTTSKTQSRRSIAAIKLENYVYPK